MDTCKRCGGTHWIAPRRPGWSCDPCPDCGAPGDAEFGPGMTAEEMAADERARNKVDLPFERVKR